MKIGDKLKELRIEKSMSQKQLANEIGISPNTYCQYENCVANPSLKVLIDIADLFAVSVDYILSREDDFGLKAFSENNVITKQTEEKMILSVFNALTSDNKLILIGRALEMKDRQR